MPVTLFDPEGTLTRGATQHNNETDATIKLDLAQLDCVKERGNNIEAACPACREQGRDKTGNHLVIYPDGKFGCAANPGDEEHRKHVWALVGITGNDLPILRTSPRSAKAPDPLPVREFRDIEAGILEDAKRLADLRGIGIEGLRLAKNRGILHFFTCPKNGRCWTVTDDRRHVRQDRRLDGDPFQFIKSDRAEKARTVGKPCWPVGLANLGGAEAIMFCEGSPDLLAAFHFIHKEGRQSDVSAVAMLGSGNQIHSDALDCFRDKRIRFYVHNDEEGAKAVSRWWRQLDGIAGRIDAMILLDITRKDGEIVADLNDLILADADKWKRAAEFKELTP